MFEDFTKQKEYRGQMIILNQKGLHTRPSSVLARCARSFRSEIVLRFKDKVVDSKSILDILTLSAVEGSLVEVEATGCDAREAVEEILELCKRHFDVPNLD